MADGNVAPAALGLGNVDSIADFQTGADRIALDDAIFTGLSAGALPASAFAVGSAAQDEDDRILYDPATGTLSFDADGLGGLDAVAFAMVAPGMVVAANDFVVI